jgi:hypothetical protein
MASQRNGGPNPERKVDLHAAARAIEAFLTALGHPPESNPELRDTGRLVATAFHEEGTNRNKGKGFRKLVLREKDELISVMNHVYGANE